MKRAAVVGGGVFGVTAALALARRGWRVALMDPGPIPHPLAESTDVSKVVRMDYGADEEYAALGERALDGWRRWNERWGAPLYHETGVTFLTRAPMAPGGFEHESHRVLARRGHRLERLDAAAIRARFPAWGPGWVDGYYNPAGGWAESGRVVARLADEARAAGVDVQAGRRPATVEEIDADRVVVAAGSWTTDLVPRLSGSLRAVGQPVFHLKVEDPTPFAAERFPVFGADIARTGYYGFPVNGGVVKIANHGIGRAMHPDSAERVVGQDETDRLRAFLKECFPRLADCEIVYTRVCVYCDTRDEHFWIARDPDDERLVVAAGGSGHAFKFAPLLGDLIADATDGSDDPVLRKFRWRPQSAARGEEAARHH